MSSEFWISVWVLMSNVAQLLALARTSSFFASSRKPAIAPLRPGIGTPAKIFSNVVNVNLRAGHAYFNASMA
jgi:hypothetical protein